MSRSKVAKNKEFVPFVEKYRPAHFDDIVLEPLNKQILTNILETSYFPNLLFYGPPGTGKTTTIINLIQAYQAKHQCPNKELVIHLNASDERGIDIIRNQINFFVSSKPLFNHGMKFVILDEVDYMTKNAQQALRYLLQLQTQASNVRFCLICNYISKIDEGLQNEFIRLRFNQLPREDIVQFLHHISLGEGLGLSHSMLERIQSLYKSDIRSMVNFLQTNQNTDGADIRVVDQDVWQTLLSKLVQREKLEKVVSYMHTISLQYNIDQKNVIKDFLNYLIRQHPEYVRPSLLDFAENVMHAKHENHHVHIRYSLSTLSSLLSSFEA